ncbi:GyrI-like domain-containing protein [Paenibacillus sp. VCA1]|uniref:GyrI-like domain-containing protein n=1 Tax=Paenibacillus sp. VCA1 TaxID=3039148 RepID=UPI002870E139|nr:GyrI-like domain-containing protein [Paenibacillus sp. VCA1]MDR9856483.1 GyrI-like domain-containing protein [Paenibacillus sp. VCA1]
MKMEIVHTNEMTSFVGIRAHSIMANLGEATNLAFEELIRRRNEIQNILDQEITYGISPPNYKGNQGPVDFYCCYEVKPLASLPHGMVHIHMPPRMYSVTYYKGPASRTESAYNFTTNWLRENGYEYDDVSYYFERYDQQTIIENDDPGNEVKIYCPIKKKG